MLSTKSGEDRTWRVRALGWVRGLVRLGPGGEPLRNRSSVRRPAQAGPASHALITPLKSSCRQPNPKPCPVHTSDPGRESLAIGDFAEGHTERESLVPASLLTGASSEGHVDPDSAHGLGPTPAMLSLCLLPSLSFLAMCSWMRAVFSRAGGTSGLQRERRALTWSAPPTP